jgi:hypothetical protein
MSLISNKVYKLLREVFPLNTILKEYYVSYKGTKLFFDFFIKDLGVLIEVQGEQHARFIKHFHEDKLMLIAQKDRDNLKIEYAQEEDIAFTRFYFDEDITKDLVLEKIFRALEEGFYE